MRSSDWSSDVCSSDLVFERFGELGDLALVNLGNAGMDIGNAHRRLGEPRGALGCLAFEFSHTRFHGRLIKPIVDRGHDACKGLVDLRQRMVVGVGLLAPCAILRSEGRRGGKECVSTGRSWWLRY